MASDFETRRKQEEAARRARAGARDDERRAALAAGGRATSNADGSDVSGIVKAAGYGAGALAAVSLVAGLATLGSFLGAVGLAGAVVFGATSFALIRYGRGAAARKSDSDARLANLAAGALSAAPTHDLAHKRARAAVEGADMDSSRRRAILTALDAARAEVQAAATQARTDAFVARCDAIVASLATIPQDDPAPSAFDELDALATDLTQEASARAEVEEALRQARGAAQRRTEG